MFGGPSLPCTSFCLVLFFFFIPLAHTFPRSWVFLFARAEDRRENVEFSVCALGRSSRGLVDRNEKSERLATKMCFAGRLCRDHRRQAIEFFGD